MDPDIEISKARKNLDWDSQFRLALDPALAGQMRRERPPADKNVCTMCGEFCAIRASDKAFDLLNLKK
jgi:thiamine biosynthesis protein ThiC